MRTALYVLLALAAPAFAGQTVYKWVDEKGVTHFSDQPVAGAEKVEMSSGAKSSASPAPPSYTPSEPQDSRAKAGPPYSRFVISSPQQDQAIINTGGQVSVQISATPSISAGHSVMLYLDGAPVSDFAGDSHEFSNMPRGTHTVKAVVRSGGRTLQETPTVTFHVRQESAAQPPVGPAMRSKPPKRAGNKMATKQPSYAALTGSTTSNKLATKQPSYAELNGGGKAAIDPRTNLPVNTKPAPAPVPPKAPPKPKPAPVGPNTGK